MNDPKLVKEQEKTLETPRMKAGIPAKMLFFLMDLVYGKTANLSKFLVLEIVARMPYAAWENVSYVAITHTHGKPKFARKIHDEVLHARAEQDNETWHLLILEELTGKTKKHYGFLRMKAIPQILAFVYYQISWILYAIKPRMSYKLNAEFEDHAEHEYMQYVKDHPEHDSELWESAFKDDYGNFETVSNLLRNIGLDERIHKKRSLDLIDKARFSDKGREED